MDYWAGYPASRGEVGLSSSIAPLAQLAEHLICNQGVVGSIPAGGSTNASIAQLAEHRFGKAGVAGSIPARGSSCMGL